MTISRGQSRLFSGVSGWRRLLLLKTVFLGFCLSLAWSCVYPQVMASYYRYWSPLFIRHIVRQLKYYASPQKSSTNEKHFSRKNKKALPKVALLTPMIT
jgi:hypothetical protein